ncbi:MAG: type II toxin-antitoxin system VapC family toxin [Rhodothermales bacterium]
MRLLLDTHTFLWWVTNDASLSQTARHLIADTANEVFVSAANAWEIAIKTGIGKLQLPEPPERYVPDRIARNGFQPLPITVAHALRVSALPPHHRDPFDRVLIAQALVEDMPLLTADAMIQRYAARVLW